MRNNNSSETEIELYHDGEDTLLHLASVFRTKDDHLHALEVDFNRGGGGHALGESICRELSGIVDDEIGVTEVLKLFLRRTDEHVVLRHER